MRRITILILLFSVFTVLVMARPYKTPVIDGTITGDGIDWDADDLAVDDPPTGADWGPNQIEQLWVTYDSLALYIGINYQVSNNAMLVYFAAGTGAGAQDVNGIDWYARNFAFADTVMADHMIAGWDGGDLGIRRIVDETTTDEITSLCENANETKPDFFRNGEVRIPWDVIYGGDPGTVPAGSRVGVVAVIAGGDNWNGPSSAPWNPGMDGSGAKTTLSNLHTIYVDRNGDGIPDTGEGSIAGTITLDDQDDLTTVVSVELFDEFDGSRVDSTATAPGGGIYLFEKLMDGSYRVEASAPGYARIKESGLVIEGGGSLTAVDILLTRAGKITGNVVFTDGPAIASAVAAFDAVTGDIAGEGAQVVPPGGGPFTLLVPDGNYYVIAIALGCIPDTLSTVITDSDSVHVGDLVLETIKATRLVLIDVLGRELESVNTTVSFPDSGIFFYASALIEARDDEGRRDWYDVAGYLQQVGLRATKLNNTTPPRGDIIFYDPVDTTEIASLALADGRGSFLLSDDEIEVLRIFTETVTGEIGGRFKLGIRSAEPEFFAIQALDTMLVADGVEEVAIYGRLLDVSGNPVLLPGVAVSFLLKESSTGNGSFTIPSVVTNADGEATTAMTATGAGRLDVTASVTWQNKELIIVGDGETDFVAVTALAGPAAAIRLSLPAEVVGFGEDLEVEAQLVDAFGNSVAESGYNVAFSSSPIDAGTIAPQFVDLDETGGGVTIFTAGDSREIMRISAVSTPSLPINDISFIIDQITTISDPPFPEPDPDHQCLEAMDLTKVLVSNNADALQFQIRFNTGWDGAHLVLLFETNNDAAGATFDPFEFPVTYAHDLLPEFVLTYKYSSNDYADMRRWSGTEWEWWDTDSKTWISTSSGTWVEGINVQGNWTDKGADWVTLTVPYDFLGGSMPSTMRFQVYLTQDSDVKRSAFDSAPHDSTLNLDFDPDDPEIDWSFAGQNIDLHHYSADYEIQGEFPPAPLLSDPAADPDVIDAGGTVTFTVGVTDNGGGIGGVLIDLSPIGGSRYQFMYDDATNGDQAALDGTYSYLHLVDPGIASGPYDLVVSARDSMNISGIDSVLTLTVQGTVEPIRVLTDEIDDDFGPNQFGREGLYYIYPTNQVFAKRAFDIEEMTIFETSKIVGGEIIPSLAFEVKIGQLPDPNLEGNANWNPPYAEINIQKIDIMIDAFKGGATEGLPNRQNDFASWDAWDYAIVMEGWYKAVLTSNNQNTPSAWSQTVQKSDRAIILLADFAENKITGIVSMESLGNPTPEDILKWDITVVMTSHDGNSDDNNFGDSRWVNASVSEWQIGGGDNSDRDPNIMDLMLSPGTGKTAGRTQSEMLDWKTAESTDRVNNGLTPCYIDMTTFEDQGPPAIDVGDKISETVPFDPLENAPLYYTAVIIDDDQVARSFFRWRPDSATTDTWQDELSMGYAGGDIWSVDLPAEDMLENVILAPLDSTWNIEFEIEAVDRSGNVTITPLQTMEINLPVETFAVYDIDMNEDFEVRAPEGTLTYIPTTAIPQNALDVRYNFKLSSEYSYEFGLEPPGATPVNVYRKIEFEAVFRMIEEGGDTVDVTVPVPEFEDKISISFHYPQYSISGIDEDLIGVYEYTESTEKWIYIGGTVNPYGNLITVAVSRPGTYALFYNPEFRYNPGEIFSGVVFSPNPFSPNGDGLYEETEISFYLNAEATVTIEIYDMDGNRKRILERRFSITAEDTPDAVPRRVTGFTWDGRDNSGYMVSYGIYICRFTVTYQQAAGQRTIRHNAAVAVIK